MGKESTVEINGHHYRYQYDEGSQKTLYRGPVGDAPPLSEEEFMSAMAEPDIGESEKDDIFAKAIKEAHEHVDPRERDIHKWIIDSFNKKYGIDVEMEHSEPVEIDEDGEPIYESFIAGELGRGDHGGIGISTEYDRGTATDWDFFNTYNKYMVGADFDESVHESFDDSGRVFPTALPSFYQNVANTAFDMSDPDINPNIEDFYEAAIEVHFDDKMKEKVESDWEKRVEEYFFDEIKTNLKSRDINFWEKEQPTEPSLDKGPIRLD